MPNTVPQDFDEYIVAFPPNVRAVLKKIRLTVRKTAPKAEERISYRMPAFFQDGVLIYFASFKSHIGVYPPVKGDAKLLKSLARYRGPKGNLRFPLDEPIPFDLISRIVKARLEERQEQRALSCAGSVDFPSGLARVIRGERRRE